MKRLPILFLFLCCAGSVFAQQTPVKGTVIGPNTHPWANGTAHASLVCPGNAQAYIGTSPIARDTPTVALDGAGTLHQQLYDTSFMVDVNGQAISCNYVYRITEQCSIANFSTNPLTGITGTAVVDLSSQINATSVNLSPQCDNTGGITGVNWFLNNTLVGTEPGGDVVQGTNQTITATDDPSNSRVHYTFNASGAVGSGITPCPSGVTQFSGAPWGTEAANTLTPSNFNNGGSWGPTFGWLTANAGATSACSSLFWVSNNTQNNNVMATANSSNVNVAYWSPDFGFNVDTCNALAGAGFSSLFPAPAGCIGANGHFRSFYNTTWSNRDLAHGTSCVSQLGNGSSIPPAVLCTDGSSNVGTLASTGAIVNKVDLLNGGTPTVTLLSPSSSHWNFTFPTDSGTTGQVLQTDGSGNTFWASTTSAASITTRGSDLGLTANTLTTVTTKSVTMPSTGCPCRAFVSYSIHLNGGSSQVVDADVSDATNRFAGGALLITGSHSYAGVQSSSYSSGTYANGASVTFTLEIEVSNSGDSVQAAPNFAGFQNTWLNVVIMTSN